MIWLVIFLTSVTFLLISNSFMLVKIFQQYRTINKIFDVIVDTFEEKKEKEPEPLKIPFVKKSRTDEQKAKASKRRKEWWEKKRASERQNSDAPKVD